MPKWLKFTVLLLPILCLFFIGDFLVRIYGGPLSSGALRLLLPTLVIPRAHDLPKAYVPFHRGHIDLGTGLYVRIDEDLVVHGAAPMVLRRTYRTNDERSRPFGIGASHDGEWFIIGDRDRFQWVSVALADGGPLTFSRVSPGTSYDNALYEHRSTPTAFLAARLGWTGLGWAMRRQDGSLFQFEGCGPPKPRPCGLVQVRDADGHRLSLTRDGEGRLLKMEEARQWIAFDYDGDLRIVHAADSTGGDVRYTYDAKGRLVLVQAAGGIERRYTYTDRDEMATILEPDIAIENTYEGGRCIRQVTRVPGDAKPYVLDFEYHSEAGRIVRGDIKRSDGTWTQYGFDEHGYTISQVWGHEASIDSRVVFEREAPTEIINGVTVSCRDRSGQMKDHSRFVSPGEEEETAWDLLMINCGWNPRARVQ